MREISADELATLTRRNDLVAAMLLVARLGFHVALSLLVMWAFAHGWILLGVLALLPHLAAYSFLGWAGVGHELFHNSVFSRRGLNQLLFRAFSILTWNNYFYFQASHPHHHRLTLAENDPEGVRPPRLSWLTLLQLLTFDVTSFRRRLSILVQNALGRVPDTASSRILFPADSPSRARLCAAARVVLGVHLALVALFIATKLYWLILLVSLAPFCLTFFNRTLALAQHYGLEGSGRDYARSCRTVRLDPILSFFYADMNYHVEHHYFPAVPHYNLRRLHRLAVSRTDLPNIAHGYLGALRELARHGVFPMRR